VAYRTHDDIGIADLGGGRFVVGWSVAGYDHNGAESTVWDTQGFSHGSMGLSQADAGPGEDGGTCVTALADGGYVMAWRSGGEVEYRVFNGDGTPRAANFYTVNQEPVAVFGAIDINDPDHSMIAQAVVTISPASSAAYDGLSLDAGFNPAENGLTVTFLSGVLTISGEAPAAVYKAALEALRFATTNNGHAGERSLGVVLTDADSFSSNTLTVPIEVHAAPNPGYGSAATIAADNIARWNYSDDIAVDLGFGNDTLEFEAQHAHVSGGQGNDSIYGYTHAQADINGGDGNDTVTLYSSHGHAVVDGGSGDDSLNVYDYSGGTGSIAVAGGDGDDTVSVGGYTAHASVDGGAGDDILFLNTYNGIYTVIGGAGNDHILNNDPGAHTTYSWQSGDASSAQPAVDTISGYNVNNDTIDLRGLLDDLAGGGSSHDERLALISFEAIQADSSRDMVISVHNAPQGEVVQQIVLENALAPDQNTEALIAQMNILLQSGGN
jgi:Ca2+-binding RTX toxin-like protein